MCLLKSFFYSGYQVLRLRVLDSLKVGLKSVIIVVEQFAPEGLLIG